MTGRAMVIQADALRLPLPDESVDLCITSPPYFALRSYSTQHKQQEIGSEATPQEYLEALWAATAEMVRVLKPTGSIFVDLGDKYGGFQANPGTKPGFERKLFKSGQRGRHGKLSGSTPKSLCLIPERYRVGCVDRLGLIARAVICWNKPNGLPESVQDRVRRSHEDWVHLVKQPRYYSAIDEVRESYSPLTVRTYPTPYDAPGPSRNGKDSRSLRMADNPLGKLPGSVWTIPSEPLRLPDHLGVDHYAAFPSEWPRRLILGWSPPGICVDCGQGRVPVVERALEHDHNTTNGKSAEGERLHAGVRTQRTTVVARTEATILGYACSCTPYTDHPGTGESNGAHGVPGQDSRAPDDGHAYFGSGGRRSATSHGGVGDRPKVGPWREYHLDRWTPPPTRPAIILDPFGGTGTTALVARALGRIGLSFDLSHAYSRAAKWRIFDSQDAGKAVSRTNLERQGVLPIPGNPFRDFLARRAEL